MRRVLGKLRHHFLSTLDLVLGCYQMVRTPGGSNRVREGIHLRAVSLVSTSPGEMLKNSTPSLLYSALNLATATFMPALLIEYGAEEAMLNRAMSSMSAIPDDMVATFLTLPFRMRGMYRLKR